jgi:hypothetical protein
MPATGGDHPRQHLAPVVRQLLAAVAAVAMLAASSCRLNSDGIGDQGDAARTDAGDAGAPPNVDRVDGGTARSGRTWPGLRTRLWPTPRCRMARGR